MGRFLWILDRFLWDLGGFMSILMEFGWIWVIWVYFLVFFSIFPGIFSGIPFPQLSEHYGPLFTVWLGPRPVLVLCGTEVIREALLGQPEAFAGRGRMPTLESTFRGYGESHK